MTINQPATRRSFNGVAHCSAVDSLSQPCTPTRVRNERAGEVTGCAGEHPGREQVGAVGGDQVLDPLVRAPR